MLGGITFRLRWLRGQTTASLLSYVRNLAFTRKKTHAVARRYLRAHRHHRKKARACTVGNVPTFCPTARSNTSVPIHRLCRSTADIFVPMIDNTNDRSWLCGIHVLQYAPLSRKGKLCSAFYDIRR